MRKNEKIVRFVLKSCTFRFRDYKIIYISQFFNYYLQNKENKYYFCINSSKTTKQHYYVQKSFTFSCIMYDSHVCFCTDFKREQPRTSLCLRYVWHDGYRGVPVGFVRACHSAQPGRRSESRRICGGKLLCHQSGPDPALVL